MGKKDIKCIICGGPIKFDQDSEQYKCSECNANYEENLFKHSKNTPKTKKGKLKVRWLVVIITTIYLLWLIYWFLL